jgi:hypothetical protein
MNIDQCQYIYTYVLIHVYIIYVYKFVGDYFGEVAMMTGSPYVSSMVASKNSILIAFTERTLRLVLRDDQAKLAEMKLRIKGTGLMLTNFYVNIYVIYLVDQVVL